MLKMKIAGRSLLIDRRLRNRPNSFLIDSVRSDERSYTKV